MQTFSCENFRVLLPRDCCIIIILDVSKTRQNYERRVFSHSNIVLLCETMKYVAKKDERSVDSKTLQRFISRRKL